MSFGACMHIDAVRYLHHTRAHADEAHRASLALGALSIEQSAKCFISGWQAAGRHCEAQ